MISVPSIGARPTNLASLPGLLAYAQGLGLERHLSRAKWGIPTLALALVWLVLAWRGTGRPERLDRLDEPLLAALLGRERRPGLGGARRAPAAVLGAREAGPLREGLVGQPRPPPARLPPVSRGRCRHRPGRHLPAGARRRPGRPLAGGAGRGG